MSLGDQIGMKAQGLSVEALFHHGLPNPEALETMMIDLDEQLAENSKLLESCVKDLLTMTNDLTGNAKNNFTNPLEAVDILCQGHLLDKSSCYDPEPEAIAKMLRSVIRTLDEQPGCEESLLQSVLKLSSSEGLSLPNRPNVDHSQASVLSINTAVDHSEQVVDKLWSDICKRFRRFLLDRLMKLPIGQPPHKINLNNYKRLEYVQSLCALNSVEEIWSRYRSIRGKQVDSCLRGGSTGEENPTFTEIVTQFSATSHKIQIMIAEDMELLSSGIFNTVTTVFNALQDLYIDRLQEEISSMVDSLQDEIEQQGQPEKEEKHSRELPKSTSEFVKLGALKGTLRRQHSKSLDSLYDKSGDVFTDLNGSLPGEQLKSLAILVGCFLRMETYLNTLQHGTVWEATGNALRKSIPKGSLKSALKSPSGGTKSFPPSPYENPGFQSGLTPPTFGTQGAIFFMESSNVKVIEPSDKLNWDWKIGFRRVMPDIAKALELHIRHITDQAHTRDLKSMEKLSNIETVDVPVELTGGRLDYPRRVSKILYDVINEMEALLALAKAGRDGCFTIVKSAYVDASSLALKNISVRLAKISSEVSDKKLDFSNLYIVLSTAAYTRNHLLFFDQLLSSDDSSKKRFQGLYRQFCDQVDSLSRQIIQHHSYILSTMLLHDAESHDLESNKEFYEDERCSFSIQMWHLHLKSLKSDLWKTCPPKVSQSILAAVLQESLTILTQRYSRAVVSARRTHQFRCDLTTILVVVSEILFPSTPGINTYLDTTINLQPYYSIHNTCSTLLAVIAIIGSPLETLYKVYKKGFYKKRHKGDDDSANGYPSQWLTWIRPALFPQGKTCFKDMQTTNALYLQVKLLSNQPEPSWPLLLQAMLMKEHALSVMLLAKAAKCTPPPPEGSESVNITLMTSSEELYFAFTDLLLQCSSIFPGAMAHVLLTVIDRSDTWELFDDKSVLGKTHHVPPWIKAVIVCLQPFVSRVIEPAVRLLLERHIRGPDLEPLTVNLDQLPCGCTPASKDEASENTAKDVIGEALYSLVMQLIEDTSAIPTALSMFFRASQDRMYEKPMHSPHNSVALKIIASAIRIALSDIEYIEGLVGLPLADMITDSLKMLSECTYHVLCSTATGKVSGTPRIASLFMKANRNWLQEQLEILTDHFTNPIFEIPESEPLENYTEEYVENLLINISSYILNSPSGETSLKHVYNFIMNNDEWILGQLDIPPLIGSSTDMSNQPEAQFRLAIDPVPTKIFNPLHQYCHIADCKFDHAMLAEWHFDWQRLLQSDLGLTESGFRTFLSHRYEMREGAHLDENDRKPVQVLKKKFDLETSDLS